MNYKDMVEKTGLRIVGICKGVNEYVQRDTGRCYYSVDVEIAGTKGSINVKLPAGYDKAKLIPYDLVQLSCSIQPTFDRKGIRIVALPNAPQQA